MAWAQPGFETLRYPGAFALARPEATHWTRHTLENGRGLHVAASLEPSALRLEGRRPVYVIPGKGEGRGQEGTEVRWAVRHYARGGRFAAAVLEDRFLRLGRPRAHQEIRASEAARERGIPTPRVLAAAVYPSGWYYRADLVTEFVPHATDLAEALFDTTRKGAGGSIERQDALRAAGTLIRRMAEAGLRHRDIHAGNILLDWRGASPKPHLLDLDRCEVKKKGAGLNPESMLQRLRRSLRKWESWTGLRISDREWTVLEEAVSGR